MKLTDPIDNSGIFHSAYMNHGCSQGFIKKDLIVNHKFNDCSTSPDISFEENCESLRHTKPPGSAMFFIKPQNPLYLLQSRK